MTHSALFFVKNQDVPQGLSRFREGTERSSAFNLYENRLHQCGSYLADGRFARMTTNKIIELLLQRVARIQVHESGREQTRAEVR